MKEFYVAIAQVYQEVARAVPVYPGNPCGDCRSCCTASLKRHHVSELEFATMTYHLGEARVKPFRDYLARQRDSHGSLLYTECPNLEPHGCSVHEYRPMACRLYGHFRSESAQLFDHCAFRGKEVVFPDEQEHLLTPGQARLSQLSIEYLSYFPSYSASATTAAPREPQTDFERASQHQLLGEYEAAIELLSRLPEADSPTALLMVADCYEALSDYPSALSMLEKALLRSPANPELYTRKGSLCLWLGRFEPARQALERSLELAPGRRNALGLLGFIHHLEGDLLAAERHLSQAVQLEEEPGPYRLPLAQTLLALGQRDDALLMLERAAEFAPSRAQAVKLLSELTPSP